MKVHIGPYPEDNDRERKIDVKIHDYDTWNMDITLAHIIVPMLKQLKATQHGAPMVDSEDAPQFPVGHLDDDGNDEFYFDRWNYVMDEMIFAFESKLTDWEDQFWIRHPQMDLTACSEDDGSFASPIRWFDEGKCDYEGMKRYQERMQNGFKLFGKYYDGLWD